jgi:ribonuclease BN (tRNA processing enzyme)
MDIEFWGVRGTVPVSSPETAKYGGATMCAAVRSSSKDIVVVDAGTGIKPLGDSLVRSRKGPLKLHLLLTHFHLDHIVGFPFFAPLWSADTELVIYAPAPPAETEAALSVLMGGRFFPLDYAATAAAKSVRPVPNGTFAVGGLRISACPLHHPQGSVAYKIEESVRKVVFATDTEHPELGVDVRLRDFSRGADLLVCDATFTPEEYAAGRKGWGHSTWQAGARLAKEAGVKKLLLSHLNPDHNDSRVDMIVNLAKWEFPAVEAARAGWRRSL